MCFFGGGTRFSEQRFGIGAYSECACLVPYNPDPSWLVAGAVQLNPSLLTLSVIAMLLPAVYHNAVQTGGVDPLTNQQEGHDILSISRFVSTSLWCSILVN
jgi:Ca2+:H+ antiporter